MSITTNSGNLSIDAGAELGLIGSTITFFDGNMVSSMPLTETGNNGAATPVTITGLSTRFVNTAQTDFDWTRTDTPATPTSLLGAINANRDDLYEFVELIATQGAASPVAAGANLIGVNGIDGITPTGKLVSEDSTLQAMLEGLADAITDGQSSLTWKAPVWYRAYQGTAAELSALVPTTGMVVINSDTDATFTNPLTFWRYNGTAWVQARASMDQDRFISTRDATQTIYYVDGVGFTAADGAVAGDAVVVMNTGVETTPSVYIYSDPDGATADTWVRENVSSTLQSAYEAGQTIDLGSGDFIVRNSDGTTELLKIGQFGGNTFINMYSSQPITVESMNAITFTTPADAFTMSASPTGAVPLAVATVEYVDNAVDGLTFSNGLTRTTDLVELGGTLTKDTVITPSTFNFTIGAEPALGVSGIHTNLSSNYIRLGAGDVGYLEFYSSAGGAVFTDVRTGVEQVGMLYAGDYELNFVNRSLVTKQYVDGAVAAGGGWNSVQSR
jgi:hypothetical protein